MRFSLNMLKTYLKLDKITFEELLAKISLQMIEIEGSHKLSEATGLVIGKVLKVEKHQNSDHLNVCQVDVKSKVLQIVCGASNVRSGMYVITALENAKLPNGMVIKHTSIRGVESFGMLCSYQEIGIDEKFIDEKSKTGIADLKELPLGSDAIAALDLNDYSIELGLTPNRSDLMSVLGIAYDLGAILNQKIKLRPLSLKESTVKNNYTIKITSDKCLNYACRVIKGITVTESPAWLKSRLMASGIRSINNIVDATNYMMIEYGQPFHAFDSDLFASKEILIRQAQKAEKVITLDGNERALLETDLVITNGKEIKALAGVMGSLNSGVHEGTTSIILESAVFDSETIRKTSRRLNLISDSSLRFERGVDQNFSKQALDYLAELIKMLSPEAEILSGIQELEAVKKEKAKIKIALKEINKALGTELKRNIVASILKRLAFENEFEKGFFRITVPTRRGDITNGQDIIEEIARIYDYQNIKMILPSFASGSGLSAKQYFIRRTEDFLAANGLNQVYTHTLIEEKDFEAFLFSDEEPLKLVMPLSAERTTLRMSILHGLHDVLKYNSSRINDCVNIFEISKLYAKDKEELRLAFLLEGELHASKFQQISLKADFFLGKGLLESLFRNFGLVFEYRPYSKTNKNIHPFRSAEIYLDNQFIGLIGELHPAFLQENNLKEHIFMEINLDIVFEKLDNKVIFQAINKFPRIIRDLSLVVPKKTSAQEIIEVIKRIGKQYITEVSVFDQFLNLSETTKSLTFKLIFEDFNETLKSEIVDNLIQELLKALNNLNISLRQ
ncbi:MAG: phenylalanine--tRNA ligase subunit beta [Erysipelotrichales bacterium]|nr:phenylalanine--tRNA ligase subunit beta [Erysipelotrichales bacterium]